MNKFNIGFTEIGLTMFATIMSSVCYTAQSVLTPHKLYIEIELMKPLEYFVKVFGNYV